MKAFFIILLFIIGQQLIALGQQEKLAKMATMAKSHLASKNYSAALQSFTNAINDPFFSNFEKVSKREKKDIRSVLATFEYSRAQALANLGKYSEGLANLDAAVAANPDISLFAFYRAIYKDYYFDNSGNFVKVETMFKPFEGYDEVNSLYANALYQRGYFEKALSIYSKMLKKDKAPINYYFVGKLNDKLGKKKEAKKLFKKGLDAFPTKASPDNCSFQDIQTMLLFELGKLEEGLKLAKEIIEEYPRNYCVQPYSAFLNFQAKNYEQSLLEYEKIIADNPFYENAIINKIKSLHKLGKTEEALTLLDNLIKEFPNYHTAYCARATILMEQKEFEKATADIEKAIKLMPNHPLSQQLKKELKIQGN